MPDTPRTDPHKWRYRMRLLSWMCGVKANSGIWMEHTRLREPPVRQSLQPVAHRDTMDPRAAGLAALLMLLS